MSPAQKASGLRGNDKRCQVVDQVAELGVGDDDDLLDVFAMVAHKSKVDNRRSEGVPPRAPAEVGDGPVEIAVLVDLRVDRSGQFLEVALLQG